MGKRPQTWYYGLVSKWWAEFKIDGPEIAYYKKLIMKYGQPALDVACGTGRLLLPYLRDGLDVDGCDISSDMLSLCLEKAKREDITPRLYQQAMHELDLPRTYQTIFVCGAFGLGGNFQQDIDALQRFYQHLEPGGILILDSYLSYEHVHEWQYWVKEKRSQLPGPWITSSKRKRASDGTEYELCKRIIDVNPLDQIITHQICVKQWKDDHLLAEDYHTLIARRYFKNEIIMLLEQAGFYNIEVQGDFCDVKATNEHKILVFIAKK